MANGQMLLSRLMVEKVWWTSGTVQGGCLERLYRNERNVSSGFEWRFARLPQDESQPRIYNTPSTSNWWRLAEVSDDYVSCARI